MRSRGNVLEEAAEARGIGQGAKRPTGPTHGAGLNGRNAGDVRSVGDQELRGEVVSAFDDDAVTLEKGGSGARQEAALDDVDRKLRRVLVEACLGALDLRQADVAVSVECLPVQVALIDHVVVDDGQMRHFALGKQTKHRRREASGADDQHAMLGAHLKYSPRLK